MHSSNLFYVAICIMCIFIYSGISYYMHACKLHTIMYIICHCVIIAVQQITKSDFDALHQLLGVCAPRPLHMKYISFQSFLSKVKFLAILLSIITSVLYRHVIVSYLTNNNFGVSIYHALITCEVLRVHG